jgi:hypothetical protein
LLLGPQIWLHPHSLLGIITDIPSSTPSVLPLPFPPSLPPSLWNRHLILIDSDSQVALESVAFVLLSGVRKYWLSWSPCLLSGQSILTSRTRIFNVSFKIL